MNSQNNEDSINFSVIDKPEDAGPCLDFSLPQLLEEQPPQQKLMQAEPASLQKSFEQVFSKIKKFNVQSGRSMLKQSKVQDNFLQALERMQKQLSFETQSYNIYEQNPNFQNQVIQNNKSKTLSCLKTTKQTNKSSNPSANSQNSTFNDYFGPLIIDFKKKDPNEPSQIIKNQYKQEKTIKRHNSKSGSSDHSEKLKANERKNTKNKSKEDLRSVLGSKETSSRTKKYLLPLGFKKDKNKANNIFSQRGISKSQSNLKKSGQTDAYTSKVFTEYYNTDINYKKGIPQPKEKKQQVLNINTIKSRQKSKSNKKNGLIFPRCKVTKPFLHK